MAESRSEVIMGAAVLAVAIGFLAYAGKATGYASGGETYDLRASFRPATLIGFSGNSGGIYVFPVFHVPGTA